MVGDGLCDVWVLAEVSCDGFVGAVSVLLLRLLGVLGLAVPCRPTPRVAGKGALHSEEVIGVLGELALAIAGFQDELCQRDGSEDARLLLVGSEETTNFLYDLLFGEVLKRRRLQYSVCRGRLRGAAKLCCDLACQIPKTCIKPVSRAGLVGKPPMHRYDHLIAFGCIV